MCLTEKLASHGILFLFQSIFNSTSLQGGGINVFASILHTHLAGKLTFDEDNSHLMLEWIHYFLFGSFGQKTLVT